MEKTIAKSDGPKASTTHAPSLLSGGGHSLDTPLLDLSRALGNQAMVRLFASGIVQAKLRLSQPGDADEDEADRAAEQVVSQQRTPRLQRKCACGGSCAKCQEEESLIHRSALPRLHHFPHSLQRAPAAPPERDPSNHPATRTQPLVVEDEAGKLEPGQMRKSQFLALLESTTSATADAVLEAVGKRDRLGHFIKKWLAHYREKSAAQLMGAMRKYAPETAKARSAHEAISLVNQRVERAALSWAKTGKVSGLPEGMQAELMGGTGGGGGLLGAVAGFAKSGFGKGLLGFLGGGGKPEISFGGEEKKKSQGEEETIQKKSNDGSAGVSEDAASVKAQLGSGQSLDGRVQGRMSSAFGYDFSNVRVHTDSKAGELSSQLSARAFTIGSDIAFAGGEYRPGTPIGDALIAHELAHVVQQGGGKPGLQTKDASLANEGQLENDADRSAVGAVVSTWTGIKTGLAVVGANALPRLKSGLQLQKCSCGKKTLPASVQLPEGVLQNYLNTLDKTHHTVEGADSANKAREVVRHWKSGDALYILTKERKTLLIRQILEAGEAGAAVQSGILDLLNGTGTTELEEILKQVGEKELKSKLTEENRAKVETLIAARRKQRSADPGATAAEATETFAPEIALEASRQFKSNAESGHSVRKNCIEIVRTMAPQLLARDPALAEKVRQSLSRLRGVHLTMPDAGNALAELGAATGPTDIKFKNGNGNNEPTGMVTSAWDTIIAQAGKTEGWHIFGLAVFDGYHSVTVFVDNRPDGPKVYWADQWAIEQGDDFHQEPSSVSGFRRYEKAGFDAFIEEKTREWWNEVHSADSKCGQSHPRTWDRSCRYNATLKIWHLRSGAAPAAAGAVQRKAAGAPVLSEFPRSIPREAAEGGGGQSALSASAPGAVPVPGANSRVTRLLVEDNAPAVVPGQMRKAQFVAELRASISKAANPLLAEVGQTSDKCPYLNRWLDFYESQDSQHVERAVLKYAPESVGASTAQEYIAIVRQRALRAVAVWVATGKVTGVPPGLPRMPEGAPGGTGHDNLPDRSGKVMSKAKDETSRVPADAGAVVSRLGIGSRFDDGVRTRMESAFGESFAGVQLHTGADASALCSDLNARAFTVGSNVAFGPGEYKPGTPAGDALIAHELAHVVQQRNGAAHAVQTKGGEDNALETDADNSAVGAVVNLWGGMKQSLRQISQSAVPRLRSGLRLQRCDGCGTEQQSKPEDAGAAEQKKTDAGATDAGNASTPATPVPACSTTTDPCKGTLDPDKVICSNVPTPDVIEKPGDKVSLNVQFACAVKEGRSDIVDSAGTSQGLGSDFTSGNTFTREWDGKKLFGTGGKAIGTFMVDDGEYRHRLEKVKYGFRYNKQTKKSEDQFATGAGLVSKPIKVKSRAYKGKGTDHFHYTAQNAADLAAILEQEVSPAVVNDSEHKAVAWAVRNQMVRLGTDKVADARDYFKDQTSGSPSQKSKQTAEEILKKPMSDDPTSGAIKWYSPRSMPKEGDSCKGVDCGGGLNSETNDTGKTVKAFAPSFHKTMKGVTVTGVRNWYLRLYKL